MPATVIDGRAVAAAVRADCRRRVENVLASHAVQPCLAVLLIGDNPASLSYVRSKLKATCEVGIRAELLRFPATTEESVVVQKLHELNVDSSVHGILVQLPLPPSYNLLNVLCNISRHKDVDGFHLYNVGGLVIGDTVFSPCTPFGVVKLLEASNISITGQNVVVVGASNIVGKPMALMMTARNATVSICHIHTRNLPEFTLLADILIVAAGVPNLIVAEMIKPGAVVVDVGINRMPNGRIVGDVDFEGVAAKASYITPVPGGVGPMTVAMLLSNTVRAAEHAVKGLGELTSA